MSISYYDLDRKNHLNYVKSIKIIASLSRLFSDNSTPFLHYRIMENIFCSCFNAKNLSRLDLAYDAQIDTVGIGLKTFICEKDYSIEKIAEFNRDSAFLKNLNSKNLAEKLAELRNDRIQSANNIYGIDKAIYHIIARRKNQILFFETDYEKIHIDNICDVKKNKETSLSFNDEKNEYIFNFSKSVLQRKFYIPNDFYSIDINIVKNPFELLLNLQKQLLDVWQTKPKIAGKDFVILPLYSTKSGIKKVPEKSGLNQWNASGRERKYGEVYIPVPIEIHRLCPDFFPPRDMSFMLKTPNNEMIQAKLCQDNAKALMSNPNTHLANWLLNIALGLKEGELARYERLQNLGFDSVIITKQDSKNFSIDIMPLDSYQKFIDNFNK